MLWRLCFVILAAAGILQPGGSSAMPENVAHQLANLSSWINRSNATLERDWPHMLFNISASISTEAEQLLSRILIPDKNPAIDELIPDLKTMLEQLQNVSTSFAIKIEPKFHQLHTVFLEKLRAKATGGSSLLSEATILARNATLANILIKYVKCFRSDKCFRSIGKWNATLAAACNEATLIFDDFTSIYRPCSGRTLQLAQYISFTPATFVFLPICSDRGLIQERNFTMDHFRHLICFDLGLIDYEIRKKSEESEKRKAAERERAKTTWAFPVAGSKDEQVAFLLEQVDSTLPSLSLKINVLSAADLLVPASELAASLGHMLLLSDNSNRRPLNTLRGETWKAMSEVGIRALTMKHISAYASKQLQAIRDIATSVSPSSNETFLEISQELRRIQVLFRKCTEETDSPLDKFTAILRKLEALRNDSLDKPQLLPAEQVGRIRDMKDIKEAGFNLAKQLIGSAISTMERRTNKDSTIETELTVCSALLARGDVAVRGVAEIGSVATLTANLGKWFNHSFAMAREEWPGNNAIRQWLAFLWSSASSNAVAAAQFSRLVKDFVRACKADSKTQNENSSRILGTALETLRNSSYGISTQVTTLIQSALELLSSNQTSSSVTGQILEGLTGLADKAQTAAKVVIFENPTLAALMITGDDSVNSTLFDVSTMEKVFKEVVELHKRNTVALKNFVASGEQRRQQGHFLDCADVAVESLHTFLLLWKSAQLVLKSYSIAVVDKVVNNLIHEIGVLDTKMTSEGESRSKAGYAQKLFRQLLLGDVRLLGLFSASVYEFASEFRETMNSKIMPMLVKMSILGDDDRLFTFFEARLFSEFVDDLMNSTCTRNEGLISETGRILALIEEASIGPGTTSAMG